MIRESFAHAETPASENDLLKFMSPDDRKVCTRIVAAFLALFKRSDFEISVST
jgi:hypothetical protein